MSDFHSRDLAVQNAVSEMTCTPDSSGLHLTDLQHIDLVTQTHADLARFLNGLAEGIREDTLAEDILAGTLTLRSLQDALLGAPDNESTSAASKADDTDPGEMLLF